MILVRGEDECYEAFKKRHYHVAVNSGRDFQRSKIYKAEAVLKKHDNSDFKNMEEMVEWTNKKLLPYMRKKYGMENIYIRDGRGRRSACAMFDRETIKMPKFARNIRILLHEVAHLPTTDNHGRGFAKLFLELVGRFMGKEAQKDLRESYKLHKVKYILRG